MMAAKDLSTRELKLFRQKMISVYDNNTGIVKAEASMVLSMIEGELSERGIEVDEEEEMLVSYTTLQQWLFKLKVMFRDNPLVSKRIAGL